MGISSWGIPKHFGNVKTNISFPKGTLIGVGNLHGPCGVAIDLDHRVLVADCEQHKVHIFAKDGTIANSIGTTKGKDPGQFFCPRDVAVDGEGHIIVADAGNHRIQIFNKDFTFLTSLGAVDPSGKPAEGAERRQFSNPRSVAVDLLGQICVADSGNHRIQVLKLSTSGLSVVDEFGAKGSEEGRLSFPHGTAPRLRASVARWSARAMS